jgi:hypothetical protein
MNVLAASRISISSDTEASMPRHPYIAGVQG